MKFEVLCLDSNAFPDCVFEMCLNLIRAHENKELKSESRELGSTPTGFEAQSWLGVY